MRDLKLDEILEELYFLREENQQLKVDNDFLQRENKRLNRMKTGLMLNNSALTQERNELIEKLNKVTIFDLSPEAQEEAGHLLARSLLGGA